MPQLHPFTAEEPPEPDPGAPLVWPRRDVLVAHAKTIAVLRGAAAQVAEVSAQPTDVNEAP